MKFQLEIDLQKAPFNLYHGERTLLLGSCFSDNLVSFFRNAGFETDSNPMGTLFHPTAIANVLTDALDENYYVQAVKRDDLWFDWRASGTVFGKSEHDLQQSIASRFKKIETSIRQAKLLVITLGTAWGYQLESGETVGNCHKQPVATFQKVLTPLDEMKEQWTKLMLRIKEINPNLEIVFTVSPVRHVRDGLVENNRSKARLLELVHSLPKVTYFPSYEILIDVLRDYRFFKEDLVHPNAQAIQFVWNYLCDFLFNQTTRELAEEVEKINAMKNHSAIYPDSKGQAQFQLQLKRKIEAVQSEHPYIFWNEKKA